MIETLIKKLKALQTDILSGQDYRMQPDELQEHALNIAHLVENLTTCKKVKPRLNTSKSGSMQVEAEILIVLSIKTRWPSENISSLITETGHNFLRHIDAENQEIQQLNANFWDWWQKRMLRVLTHLNNTIAKEATIAKQQLQVAIMAEAKSEGTRVAYEFKFLIN